MRSAFKINCAAIQTESRTIVAGVSWFGRIAQKRGDKFVHNSP